MSLFLKGYDIIKVSMVYVSINTKQPFQNCFCYCDEVPWKWHTYNTWSDARTNRHNTVNQDIFASKIYHLQNFCIIILPCLF